MPDTDYHDAALVLVAHGSTVNENSARPARQHADALRGRGLFAEVTEAFWKQSPFVGDVFRRVLTPRIFIVPLFISDGWFTEQVIPTELGLRQAGAPDFPRVQVREGRTIHYCGAVGSHPDMTEILLARARDVVVRHPFPRLPPPADTALLIAGHGTAYSRGSRESIERQVDLIRHRALYAEVHGVFLEEAPLIREAWELGATRNRVLVPFFISDGLHTQQDIPEMLGAPAAIVRQRLAAGRPTWRNPTERQGRRLWYAGAVGSEPLLVDVILQRVRESAARK